jgi:hypothetical protein
MFDQILQKNNFIWLLLNKSCKSPSTKVNEGTLNLAELKQDDLQKKVILYFSPARGLIIYAYLCSGKYEVLE